MLTGFGREEAFIDALTGQFEARIPNAKEFALTRRVLLLLTASGVGLDVALGGLPFEESAVMRASEFVFPVQTPLQTCSAEDLVVMKAFAARPKDWIDVEGIVSRQAGLLDWNYILTQLNPLAELKGSPEIVGELVKRRAELDR